MDHRFRLVLAAMCALCGLCILNEALGQTLPDGKGKAEFVHNCTGCHRADMVTRVKETPDEWRKTVDEMAARGTDGSMEDLDKVVLYLDTHFATDKPDAPAAKQSKPPSSTSGPAVLNASEMERVNHLIAQSGCLASHCAEKKGAYTGPMLNGVGRQRTTDEIRRSIAVASCPSASFLELSALPCRP
jgi:hypothetical protein